jgi:hypothetical protein
MSRGPSLTVRRWDAADGNPSAPQRVLGIPVDAVIAEREDAPGALVTLHDHRIALTGPIAAVGRHRALRTYVRGRARTKHDTRYREWLAEVSRILKQMQPESRTPATVRRAPAAARRSTE